MLTYGHHQGPLDVAADLIQNISLDLGFSLILEGQGSSSFCSCHNANAIMIAFAFLNPSIVLSSCSCNMQHPRLQEEPGHLDEQNIT